MSTLFRSSTLIEGSLLTEGPPCATLPTGSVAQGGPSLTPSSNRNTSWGDHFTEILAEFSRTFGSRSSKYSNVRCISKAALIRELLELRNRVAHSTVSATSGQALLERLLESGLVHPVALTAPDNGKSAHTFFSIGLNDSDSELEPVELLQAMVPDGAICYFTAVHVHELSTQVPTHHHVARFVDTSPRPGRDRTETPPARPRSHVGSRKRDLLGRRQFVYRGAPYYITNRGRRRVPGIQERFYTNKTVFSVTTYEQTLLDALDRPLSCGGSSVVFEAWNLGCRRLDQDRLLHHLKAIRDHRLTRRVGYMLLEHLQHELEMPLRNYLHRARRRSANDDSASVISLLPGYEYAHTSQDWRLEVP